MKKILFLFIIILIGCNYQSKTENILYQVYNGRNYGYINHNGELVIKFMFTSAKDFSEDLAAVSIDADYNQEGFINKKGQFVIQPIFKDALSFNEGLAAVRKDKYWGFIDKTGKLVIDYQFESPGSFSEGLAAVSINDNYGFIDKTGEFVIEPKYFAVSHFSEGLAMIGEPIKEGEKGLKFGYIDKSGKFVIDMLYDDAYDFKNGYAVVTLINGPFQLIDKSGNDVLKGIEHGAVKDYSEGLLPIRIDGKYGYMTLDYQIIIKPQFENVRPFNNGRAFVSYDQFVWGIIDKEGKMIAEPQFVIHSPFIFKNGLARVDIKGKNISGDIYIDLNGNIVWPKNLKSKK